MVRSLHKSVLPPCSLLKSVERLLLTGSGANTYTEHKDIVVGVGKLPGCVSIVTGEVKAHQYVSSEYYLYAQYSSEHEKLLQEGLEMQKVDLPPDFVFVGHSYV